MLGLEILVDGHETFRQNNAVILQGQNHDMLHFEALRTRIFATFLKSVTRSVANRGGRSQNARANQCDNLSYEKSRTNSKIDDWRTILSR